MDDNFISEDDLLTFEGFLKYQAVPATSTPEELETWRGLFDEAGRRRESSPKVGLMKLQAVPGEQKYAVALRDGSELWLTMWVRCSHKGEIFMMYPRGDRDWNAHGSYHLDGTFHQKSFGSTVLSQKRQPLTATFKGSEHLGRYNGHSKSNGAVCEPKSFEGVVIVEPGILGPSQGSVGVDLVESGCEAAWTQDETNQRHYVDLLGGIHQRAVFPRGGRPSVIITIQRG